MMSVWVHKIPAKAIYKHAEATGTDKEAVSGGRSAMWRSFSSSMNTGGVYKFRYFRPISG